MTTPAADAPVPVIQQPTTCDNYNHISPVADVRAPAKTASQLQYLVCKFLFKNYPLMQESDLLINRQVPSLTKLCERFLHVHHPAVNPRKVRTYLKHTPQVPNFVLDNYLVNLAKGKQCLCIPH